MKESSSSPSSIRRGCLREFTSYTSNFLIPAELTECTAEANRSRPAIAEAFKRDKKDQPLPNQRKASSYSIPAPAPLPTKSELKAAKKRDIEKKKKRKLLGDDYVSSEEDEPTGTGGKTNPEGELVDDLESDDFAFGSGSSDDELSVMSDWSDKGEMSDMSDMSDLEGLTDLEGEEDDDDEEGLWSDEDEAEDGEPKFDSEEELNAQDDSGDSVVDSGAELDDDEEDLSDDLGDEPPPLVKKQKKVSAGDELEAAYEARRPSKQAEPKAKPTKLPTIENGKVVKSTETLDVAADSDDDFTEEEEVKPKKEKEYRSDPLGQRFGRPAVRQLLEIKNKKERVQKAREEIADLGREAAGTGEGEGGLNLLKRLLSLMAPKFNSSSAAKSAGEKPIMIDREIRVMALVSLLAVFIDVVPCVALSFPFVRPRFSHSILLQRIPNSCSHRSREGDQSQSDRRAAARMGGRPRRNIQKVPRGVRARGDG